MMFTNTAGTSAPIMYEIPSSMRLKPGELVTAVPGTDQSLVASVGTSFIDRFAGPLKSFAVRVFGTNDKAALIIGIVIGLISSSIAFLGVCYAILGKWLDKEAIPGWASSVAISSFLFGVLIGLIYALVAETTGLLDRLAGGLEDTFGQRPCLDGGAQGSLQVGTFSMLTVGVNADRKSVV